MPLIQETLNRLVKIKYFTKLNIVAVFKKIKMAEKEKWKTVVRTRYGFFEFLVMNFGFCGAPSFFQNYINDILHEHLNTFCSAYIDNIFIYSKTKEKHETRSTNFSNFSKNRSPARHRQMQVFCPKNQIFKPDNNTRKHQNGPKKLSAVFDWSIPENLKDIQSFLSFANFYKRFIRDFSKLTAPLNALAIFFIGVMNNKKTFDNFKVVFTTTFILLHYDPNKQTVVKTDVSDYMTAGVFSQYDDNGQLKPVVYFFCKMNPAECNYEIYDKKLLTIIKTFKLWKSELENTQKPVQVIIDHKNLEYFMSIKLLNPRQARWSEIFSRFNFKITHKPGSLNNKADVFTRQSGNIPKKGDNRRQFQWQTMFHFFLDIQQLTLGPISISDNSETVSNPDSIDDETFAKFLAIINDAIWAAYSENEKT